MDDLTQIREAIIRRTSKPVPGDRRFVPTDELERNVPRDIARKPTQTREIIDRSINDIGVDRTQRALRGTGLTPQQIATLASQGGAAW